MEPRLGNLPEAKLALTGKSVIKMDDWKIRIYYLENG